FTSIKVNADSGSLGKIYAIGDSLYYPVIAPVTINQNTAGYIIVWQSMLSSIKGVDQLPQLMGSGAALYIRNIDGSVMTNLIKKVREPPVDLKDPNNIYEYSNVDGNKVLAGIKPIAGTAWCILVEFSEEQVLDTATSYLQFIFIAGSGLIIIGMFITWLISRNIVKPLRQLTTAVAAVAEGNYSTVVDVNRSDEIGNLANTFNTMAEKIHASQTDLENKVVERTSQLQIANKELESFTYSVSHDLRAPLRGIIGFASILEQEYTNKLDDEAKRLTSVIKKNTQKMGDLIDDLLAFSKLGRHDIIKTHIKTNAMLSDVINGLDASPGIKWNIQSLPDINADVKAIRQVWINLLSNAIKYSRKKQQPHIEIGALIHEKENVFFIKDNGVG
ncbi:MAG: HAMP domain-containing protein, partial [Ginsengibacter sp.]